MGHGERARGALPVNTSRGVPTCAHLDQRNLWLHSGTILTRLASRKKVCHVECAHPLAFHDAFACYQPVPAFPWDPHHEFDETRLEGYRKLRAAKQQRDRLEASKRETGKWDDVDRQIFLLQRPKVTPLQFRPRTRQSAGEGDDEGGGAAEDILFAGLRRPAVDAQAQRDRSKLVEAMKKMLSGWRHSHPEEAQCLEPQMATGEGKMHQRALSARVRRQEEACSTIQRPLSARQPRMSTPAQPPAQLHAPESTRLDVGAATGAVASADVSRPCSARKGATGILKAQPMPVTTPRDTAAHARDVETPALSVEIVGERAASPHPAEAPPSARAHSRSADNNEGPTTPRLAPHRPCSAHPRLRRATHEEPPSTPRITPRRPCSARPTHEEPPSTPRITPRRPCSARPPHEEPPSTPRITPRRPCSARPAVIRPLSLPAASTTQDAELHQNSATERRGSTPCEHGVIPQISARPQEQLHIKPQPHPPPLELPAPPPPTPKHQENSASAVHMNTVHASASAARARSASARNTERSNQRAAQKAVAAAVAASGGSRKGGKPATRGQEVQVAVQAQGEPLTQALIKALQLRPPPSAPRHPSRGGPGAPAATVSAGRDRRHTPSVRPVPFTPRPPACSPRAHRAKAPASAPATCARRAPPPAFLQQAACITVQAQPQQIAWLGAS